MSNWKDESRIYAFDLFLSDGHDADDSEAYDVYAESEAQAWQVLFNYMRTECSPAKRKNFQRWFGGQRWKERLVLNRVTDWWGTRLTAEEYLINHPDK